MAGVRRALDQHVDAAEGPKGLFVALANELPRVAGRVERLRREHIDLLKQAEGLARMLAYHDKDERPNFGDIRQRAAWLLGALRHHQALETDLIYETFCLYV